MTAARPGTVNFELDIEKQHTVGSRGRDIVEALGNRTKRYTRIDLGFFMEAQSQAWVCRILLVIAPSPIQPANRKGSFQVDLGGSLAVASRGLFATGVSTDLNGSMVPLYELVRKLRG